MPFVDAGALELHRIAKQLLPTVPNDVEEHLDVKASHIIIALERHDKHADRWASELPKDRFLWIKARTKTRIAQIRDSYQQQYGDHVSVSVNFGPDRLYPEVTCGELDYFTDRLIVLSAVQQGGSGARKASQPAVAPAMSNSSPARYPLQPINRQFTAPSTESESNVNPRQALTPLPDLLRGATQRMPATPHPPSMLSMAYVDPLAQPNVEPKTEPKAERTILPKPEPTEEPNHLPRAAEVDGDRPATPEYQPREYDNPFASPKDEPEALVRGQPLRQIAQATTPERLEAGVRAGLHVLDKLREPLEQLPGHPDAQNWLEQIEKARRGAVKSRTVVGVVGNTGAGKSSVINAMLDEERLVPTNCMRACTAVVTELSYNYSSSENAKYRAEIEFIQPEEWQKELEVLFKELIDDNGHISRDISNPDSQAGVAYAKIRAVYHKHTKEMLANSSIESLMQVKHVKSVLGATKKITEARSGVFYKRLQTYVDSKEKGTEKLDKNGDKITNPTREFEHWPLIKVVKIYTKSDALSTGAVIVDLPGVHDANAARAAVAEGYMKQCTGLWIVAPINRAVDDKAAKTLLGNTFKRQLKYDGTYSAVTFICSKTDDISITEASDSLKLGAEMGEIEDKAVEYERQRRKLEAEVKSIKGQKRDYIDAIEGLDEQLEKWEELRDELEEGKTVYAPPPPKTKKRKRVTDSSRSRKKARRDDDSDYNSDNAISVNSDSDEAIEGTSSTSRGAALTEADIEGKIKELQSQKKEARRKKGSFDDEMRAFPAQIDEIKAKEAELESKRHELCIAGRNEYSRTAIRQDFAAGIKELDQENAEEEDPDHFDPNHDIRDYDEVERSLPVFCVSSRAYQSLSGRMQGDKFGQSFTTKEQTEIPQLQAHCKKLTEQGRLASCRQFLNGLDRLMTSLSLWASDDGTGAKLNDQQRNHEQKFLDRKLKDLEKALQTAVIDRLDDITDTLNTALFEKFRPAIAAAAHEAMPTANKWGAHRTDGGLHFMTYRATVRRSGVYTGASGFQDFNQQLFDPVQKQLASGWEKAFHRRLPHILQTFTRTGTDLLRKFHAAVEARCREKGHGVGRIGLLSNQLTAYQAIFNDVIAAAITAVNDGQRDINREFTPVITACMEPAYDMCANESGPGSYKRMKGHMARHVDEQKEAMFDDACERVRASLTGLVERVKQDMLDRVDGVYVGMRRDYLSVIGGVNVQQMRMSREERAARRDLDEEIGLADEVFGEVVECEDGRLEGLGNVKGEDEGDDEMMMDVDMDAESAGAEKSDDGGDDEQEARSAEEGVGSEKGKDEHESGSESDDRL